MHVENGNAMVKFLYILYEQILIITIMKQIQFMVLLVLKYGYFRDN